MVLKLAKYGFSIRHRRTNAPVPKVIFLIFFVFIVSVLNLAGPLISVSTMYIFVKYDRLNLSNLLELPPV